jgi:hypothetical protein
MKKENWLVVSNLFAVFALITLGWWNIAAARSR